MEFTKNGYLELIRAIKAEGYHFDRFRNGPFPDDTVILRHDVDFSLQIAAELSDLEAREQVEATYFVLVNTDFYNCCSRGSRDCMRRILDNGGTIGLHFDVSQYKNVLPPVEDPSYKACLNQLAQRERAILEAVSETRVSAAAFHCPTQDDICSDAEFDGMENVYGHKFFREFKYLSDSSMHWREDVDTILREHRFHKLQILTHPFWYPEEDVDLHTRLKTLCRSALLERYHSLEQNFKDLRAVLVPGDLEG